MFIMAKKNFRIRRADGSSFLIPKDFVGEIPNDVASHWLVQAAIQSGSIATPQGKQDNALEKADGEAEKKAAEADIRPDAEKAEGKELAEEEAKAAAPRTGRAKANK